MRTDLRSRIIAGDFAMGARLEEVGLAADLGVSRTPLREALHGLEQEGLVISRPRRGFIVAPLDQKAVRDFYPMLGSLEALVVESSCAALRDQVPQLRTLNAGLALPAVSPQKSRVADRAFHAALRSACTNQPLLRLLGAQEAVAYRLDGAMRRGMVDTSGSHRQHETIIAALADGDARSASDAVRDHWRCGEEAVIAWMEHNDVQ
ncbi:GntR family transcriptional regulator [Sphingomonas panacisoli]|uniref:GntR family transcriptional regulator n=1 Tax=Sphingomonas panacisoli TaxID=1813879 RepID=UPI001647EBDA|nr:GntR family transcriptional regulator [Sphingomonas panacisoli]